jgi:ABC-type nitrate/sulfonate/bicarbonate transport system permease component
MLNSNQVQAAAKGADPAQGVESAQSPRHGITAGIRSVAMLQSVLPIGILLLCWELASRTIPDLRLLLPSPTDAAIAAAELVKTGVLQRDIFDSLRRVFVALFVASVVAFPVGLLIGMSKSAAWLLEPIFGFFRPIPPLAWIPLSIVWFGISESQNIFIIFLGAFFPILVNTIQGVREVDQQLVRAARTLGANRLAIALTVLLPAALPSMFVGFRVGVGIAWMALVAGELVAASSGLGFLISQGRMLFRPDYIIVGMVTIGMIGLILDAAVRLLQRSVMKWQEA